MSAGFDKRLLFAWLALSAITLTQLGVASMDGSEVLRPNAAISSGAIAIALLKVRIILREFMEVRHAPPWLGRLTDLWVAFAGATLLGSYFGGTAFGAG